jgi:copper chaperone CopZ
MVSTTTTVTIHGMTCGHCANAVETELAKIHGVTDVSADLGTGSVTITSDTDVDSAVIAAAVDEAGYELAP